MGRLRKKPWADDYLSKSNFVVKNFMIGKKTWNEIFDNNNPLVLEIGHGKGGFLIEQIKKNKNKNFIGIEKFSSVQVAALKKLEELNSNNLVYNNLRFLNIDAFDLLDYFQKNTIEKIYLNFPDPWPKKSHYKRRLVNKSFLDIYYSLLIDKGIIEFKTDKLPLFEFALEQIDELDIFKKIEVSYDLHKEKNNIIKTEYENKFLSENKPIFYLKIQKN